MIYLASPYSDVSPVVMDRRFQLVAAVVAKLLQQGHCVFSPILHNHYMAVNHDLPRSWDFWSQIDLKMLDAASAFWVLALPGYVQSVGVQAEWQHAKSRNLSQKIIYPEDYLGKDYQYC